MKRMFIVALSMTVLAFAESATSPKDSEHVNTLLSNAKSEAVALQNDAEQLASYTRSTANWKTHAGTLQSMKTHVNAAGKIVQELADNKQEASPWQQTAIDRITPALREMADNLQSTIEHLNGNQGKVHMPPYKDYATANAELASDLRQIVADFVKYGEAKAQVEKLGSKLEISQP